MFFSPEDFSFTSALEMHWEVIRDEYEAIRYEVIQWPEKKLCEHGWDVFGLFDFPNGDRIDANCQRCPITSGVIAKQIGEHGAAGSSVLSPNTEIKPHCGYDGHFLRCHLALKIPTGDVALRVGDEVRRWEVGKTLLFDDRVEHRAWNRSMEGERVVLLIDFPEPT